MRILLGLCGGLLIANVAVFLWPDDARVAPHIYTAKSDINPHFLRLNKEVEEKHYAARSWTTEDAIGASEDCFRLGPFAHQANYELAQAVLFNANVEFQKSKRTAKESEVFRVYLGPFASQAEVADARVDLKRKKVLDHFVRKVADDEYIISLGIYTTQKSANLAVSLFDGKLEKVKLKQENIVLPDSFWLHFAIDDNDQIRNQLARMDWGEQSAKLGKHSCGSV